MYKAAVFPTVHCKEHTTMNDNAKDILAALAVAAALTIGALAYFDILTK